MNFIINILAYIEWLVCWRYPLDWKYSKGTNEIVKAFLIIDPEFCVMISKDLCMKSGKYELDVNLEHKSIYIKEYKSPECIRSTSDILNCIDYKGCNKLCARPSVYLLNKIARIKHEQDLAYKKMKKENRKNEKQKRLNDDLELASKLMNRFKNEPDKQNTSHVSISNLD